MTNLEIPVTLFVITKVTCIANLLECVLFDLVSGQRKFETLHKSDSNL